MDPKIKFEQGQRVLHCHFLLACQNSIQWLSFSSIPSVSYWGVSGITQEGYVLLHNGKILCRAGLHQKCYIGIAALMQLRRCSASDEEVVCQWESISSRHIVPVWSLGRCNFRHSGECLFHTPEQHKLGRLKQWCGPALKCHRKRSHAGTWAITGGERTQAKILHEAEPSRLHYTGVGAGRKAVST